MRWPKPERWADGSGEIEAVRWVPSLRPDLAGAMGALQWGKVLVGAGIGALALTYCRVVLLDDESGLALVRGTFVASAGACSTWCSLTTNCASMCFWGLTTGFAYRRFGSQPTWPSVPTAPPKHRRPSPLPPIAPHLLADHHLHRRPPSREHQRKRPTGRCPPDHRGCGDGHAPSIQTCRGHSHRCLHRRRSRGGRVVVGTRGRGAFPGLLGSVSHAVNHDAGSAVAVI